MKVLLLLTVVSLAAQTRAGRIDDLRKLFGEENKPDKIPDHWKENVAKCPSGYKPYTVDYNHASPIKIKIKPDTLQEIGSSRLLAYSQKDYPYQPYSVLIHHRDTNTCDRVHVYAANKPFLMRRLCLKTFAVKTVELEVYGKPPKKNRRNKKKNMSKLPKPVDIMKWNTYCFGHMMLHPDPYPVCMKKTTIGPKHFREMCFNGFKDYEVYKLSFNYVVEPIHFYHRDMIMFICIKEEEN